MRDTTGYYYPKWLTDPECGDDYKAKLVKTYDEYYKEQDSKVKAEKLKELKIYLTIVCDVVAYRYLVKYYTNLFHKLRITVEEYMEYKVERMFSTIKDKKEQIDDILSYVYMSFMLSSPRLIYDYGERVGRCKLVRENIPYFQVQRLKYFFIDRENTTEHILYDFSVVDLDSTEKSTRSDIEKYSLSRYLYDQSIKNADTGFDKLKDYLKNYKFKYEKSKQYLLYIFDNWSDNLESDYQNVKRTLDIKEESNFNLSDYIRYKYEHKQVDLTYDEFIDVLHTIDSMIKEREKLNL